MENLVVLVDEHNNEIGTMEKLEAHEKGVLHRAFSVCLFNKKGELLLQQRDVGKYHCGELWTNTVCSHQKPGESTLDASVRRLKEEMGITIETSELKIVDEQVYRAEFKNGLIEHEYDFVIVGKYDGEVVMNPEEAMNYKWEKLENIETDVIHNRDKYTPWFKLIIKNKMLVGKY